MLNRIFSWVADKSERWPWVVLALVAVLSVVSANGVTRLESDFSFQAMLPKGKESVQVFEEIENEFGGTFQERVLLEGENVLQAQVLRAVYSYRDFLEENASLWGKLVNGVITPLDNMYLLDERGEVVTDIFGRPVPLDPATLGDTELVEQVRANLERQREAAAQGYSNEPKVSPDDRAMLITVNQVVEQNDRLADLFEDETRRYFGEAGVEGIYVGGDASLRRDANRRVGRDTRTLFLLAVLFILVVLFVTFRRVTDVFLTLGVVMITVLWVMGFGGWVHIPFTYTSIGIMPLVLGIGIAYAIHVLSRYYEERRGEAGVFPSARKAVATVGVAVFLTAVTTAIGFASFGVSDIPPVKDFGILCLVGVVLSFLLSVTMLPALVVLRDRRKAAPPERARGEEGRGKVSVVDKLLVRVALLAEHHRFPVLLITGVVLVTSFFAAANLRTEAEFQNQFEDSPSAVAEAEIDRFFGGQVLTFTLVKGDIADPGTLEALLDYEGALAESGALSERGEPLFARGGIMSAADIVARNSGGVIPSSREEIRGELNLLQSRSSREGTRIVSDDLHAALILCTVKAEAQGDMEELARVLRGKQSILEEAGLDVGQTGRPVMVSDVLSSLTPTLVKTSLLALGLCLVVVSLIFRSPFFGLAATSVVFVSIALEMIALFLLGWPLDFMTVMVTALIIGAGIDFGIHVTHRFREEWNLGCDNVDEAIRQTVKNVGRALLSAAVTTAGAFAVLAFSRVEQLKRFGGVTALSLVFALLVALLVLPTLLALLAGRKEKKGGALGEGKGGP